MSRTSAVGLLVDARKAVATDLHEKPTHEVQRGQQTLQELERLLLDVRIGRTREFQIEYPNPIYVVVSD